MKTVNEFGTVNEVLEKYPEISYALVWRHNDDGFQEFVAAWMYDEKTGTWGQGHYFWTLREAMQYIEEKCGNSKEAAVKRLLERGRDYINECENTRYEYKDTSPDMFWQRGQEIWAMEDMIEYLESILAEDEL